jgi:DegV family protein with EDD domain
MLRIATDGSADMPPGWKEKYDIEILPINIHIGDKDYIQGVDIDDDEFYRIIREEHVIPKTASPSPNQFIEFYRKIASCGDTVLSIHVADRMSGTLSAAKMAAQELINEMKIVPFDSGSGSAALAFYCMEARVMDDAGFPLQHIIERLERIREKLTIVMALNSLEFAALSGRIHAFQALVASFLQIKPIIELREGMLEIVEKVRTRSRAIERVLEIVRKNMGMQKVNVAIVHALDPDTGRSLLEKAKLLLNVRDIILTELSISVAAHMGPGTVGIVAYPVQD